MPPATSHPPMSANRDIPSLFKSIHIEHYGDLHCLVERRTPLDCLGYGREFQWCPFYLLIWFLQTLLFLTPFFFSIPPFYQRTHNGGLNQSPISVPLFLHLSPHAAISPFLSLRSIKWLPPALIFHPEMVPATPHPLYMPADGVLDLMAIQLRRTKDTPAVRLSLSAWIPCSNRNLRLSHQLECKNKLPILFREPDRQNCSLQSPIRHLVGSVSPPTLPQLSDPYSFTRMK